MPFFFQQCAAGFFSNPSATECEACQAGFYSLGMSANCTICPLGFYTTSNSSTSCIICPEAHACSLPHDEPVPCSAGSTALAGSSTCSPCPVGMTCSSGTPATFCQLGEYALAGQCHSCPKGYYCPSPTDLPVRSCSEPEQPFVDGLFCRFNAHRACTTTGLRPPCVARALLAPAV